MYQPQAAVVLGDQNEKGPPRGQVGDVPIVDY